MDIDRALSYIFFLFFSTTGCSLRVYGVIKARKASHSSPFPLLQISVLILGIWRRLAYFILFLFLFPG